MSDGMTDKKFADLLKDNDAGVWKRWDKASGGKRLTSIGTNQLVAIALPIFEKKIITPHQAKALSLLFLTNLSNGAHATLRQGIADAYENDFFFKGSARALTTVKELELLNGALGMGSVGKINFVSPETGLEYIPDLYSAIRSLVHQEKIRVFEVDAAMLKDQVGLYRSDSKRLIMYLGWEPERSKMFMVHEATHAIQDWKDLAGKKVKHKEADAFIAGAVAAMTVNKDTKILVHAKAEKPAVELILAGQATRGNDAWNRAYADVVKAVEVDESYIATAERVDDWNEKKGEEAVLKAALVHFKVAEFVATMGVDIFTKVNRFIPGQR